MRLVLMILIMWGGWVADARALLCISPTLAGVTATQTYAGSGGGGYNPFLTTTYPQTINFTVQLLAVGTCNYFVALRAGQSGNGNARTLLNGSTLPYEAYSTGSNLLLPGNSAGTGANNVIAGSFTTQLYVQSRAHSFTWTVPAQQMAAYATGGYYTDPTVYLDLYEGVVTGTKTLVASTPITFRATVVRSFDLSVVGSGGAFNIATPDYTAAFGTAVSGAIRDFDVIVRSTDGYRLAMQSANRQKLVHTQAGVSTTIPYTIRVNNIAVDLSGGGVVNTGTLNGTTPLAGTSLPVRVTLGTLTGQETAGTYKDTITVTVSAY